MFEGHICNFYLSFLLRICKCSFILSSSRRGEKTVYTYILAPTFYLWLMVRWMWNMALKIVPVQFLKDHFKSCKYQVLSLGNSVKRYSFLQGASRNKTKAVSYHNLKSTSLFLSLLVTLLIYTPTYILNISRKCCSSCLFAGQVLLFP